MGMQIHGCQLLVAVPGSRGSGPGGPRGLLPWGHPAPNYSRPSTRCSPPAPAIIWKSHNFSTLDDGLFDAVIAYIGKLPSPQCEIFFGAIGGATTRPAPGSAAYAHRDAKFVMNVHGRWEDPADDKLYIGWARDFFNASAPFASSGVYVNFLTADEGDRVRSAYGPNYGRLAQVKRKYDPDNLFRMNQNIEPA